MLRATFRLVIGCMVIAGVCASRDGQAKREAAPESDASFAKVESSPTEPQLYTVATAHLDTQWRWTIQQTINEFIPATLHDNFELFEKYPNYTFSFEGAFRYMLMKEYYPQEYERLVEYIDNGRWKVAGSWVDAVDVNIPSPESLIRHALYGNGFFRSEFGVTSRDVYLPDCFGFGFALPSVAAHCGLIGFSTQKLTWGSSIGIPFDIGLWEGVDGSRLVAAVNPGDYVARLESDQSADSVWVARAVRQGERSGLYAALRYFGTGDRGGAPTDESVNWLERSMAGAGPLTVRSVGSDQLARDLTAGLRADLAAGLRGEIFERGPADPVASGLARLPHYRGELLMTDHGAGCYTSQSAMKRWNRKNERLADAAERAAATAHWLGGADYPRERLRTAWIRFLWHQFHDDLTGTSIPEAYEFSWNDELISLNEFASVLSDGVGAVSRALDTHVSGVPLVVFNPLSIPREDIVEADVVFEGRAPEALRVYGPDGVEVPSQVLRGAAARGRGVMHGAGTLAAQTGEAARVVFVASAPSVGFSVYDVRPSEAPCNLETGLSVSGESLENKRYRVRFNENGDIASIFDKAQGCEMIAAPLQLQLIDDSPRDWAAWEIDYDDLMASPRAAVGGPAVVNVIENGPARVTVEVLREAESSTFRQRISLAAGDAGNRVPIDLEIDWRTRGTLLKAAFPLAVSGDEATYDLGVGTVRRGANRPELYEVPAQQWADITDEAAGYGVAILNDCRYGWDKPDNKTLRLTLLHTPEVNENWRWIEDQATQDLGRHRLSYALYGHEGGWVDGGVTWVADRLNQSLLSFQAPKHAGDLGRSFSLVGVRTPGGYPHPQVAVRAIKLAEEGDEIVIRLQELTGAPADDVLVSFAGPVIAAREVNGAEEQATESVSVERGALKVKLARYQPRAFAVRLAEPPLRLGKPTSKPVGLPYNVDGISLDDDRADGDFDGAGHALAGELLPGTLVREGVVFRMGPRERGRHNVLACRGQELDLPEGDFNRLYILAAAVGGGRSAEFTVESAAAEGTAPRGADAGPLVRDLWIQDYAEPVGQWDSRLAGAQVIDDPLRITPAYINRDQVAWVGTHRHDSRGLNEAYTLAHVYKYRIDLPSGAHSLRLPNEERIRILSITAAGNENDATRPAQPLFDVSSRTVARIHAPLGEFVDSTVVTLDSPNPRASIRYTLDGAEPNLESPRYEDPLTLTATTTVRARAFAEGMDTGYVASATFERLEPREAISVREKSSGLACRYYEGVWEKLPSFEVLTADRSSTEMRIGLPDYAREEDFALSLSGYFEVPSDGLYSLHLWSDDGSALYVGDELVIDNDGLHGNQPRRCNVALKKGLHPIRVNFFQHLGGRALDLQVEGPGVSLRSVPSEWLSHGPE